MTLLVQYESKKALQAAVGKQLTFRETTMFGTPEYKPSGKFAVARRPSIEAQHFGSKLPGREFFAEVTMADNVIVKVE